MKTNTLSFWIWIALLGAALAACQKHTAPVDVPPSQFQVLSTSTPAAIPTRVATIPPTLTPSSPDGPVDALVDSPALVKWAQADLAERLGVSVDQIALVSFDAVRWRDSSLGCPQPGMMYAQVITPGYLIVLQVEEQQYEYHAGRDSDTAIFCDAGRQKPLLDETD